MLLENVCNKGHPVLLLVHISFPLDDIGNKYVFLLSPGFESASLHVGERLALVIPSPDPTHVGATSTGSVLHFVFSMATHATD